MYTSSSAWVIYRQKGIPVAPWNCVMALLSGSSWVQTLAKRPNFAVLDRE